MLVYFVLFVKNILKQINKSHLINKKQVKKIVLNKDKIKHNYVKMSVEYGKLKLFVVDVKFIAIKKNIEAKLKK